MFLYSWLRSLFLVLLLLLSHHAHSYLLEAHENIQDSIVIQLFRENPDSQDTIKGKWITQYFQDAALHLGNSDLYNIYHFNGTVYYTVFDKSKKKYVILEHPATMLCHDEPCRPIPLKATVIPLNMPYSTNRSNSWIKLFHIYDPATDRKLLFAYGNSTHVSCCDDNSPQPPSFFLFKKTNQETTWTNIISENMAGLTHLYDLSYYNGTLFALGETTVQDLQRTPKKLTRIFESNDTGEQWYPARINNTIPENISFSVASLTDNNTLCYYGFKQKNYDQDTNDQRIHFMWQNSDSKTWHYNHSDDDTRKKTSLFLAAPPDHLSDILMGAQNGMTMTVKYPAPSRAVVAEIAQVVENKESFKKNKKKKKEEVETLLMDTDSHDLFEIVFITKSLEIQNNRRIVKYLPSPTEKIRPIKIFSGQQRRQHSDNFDFILYGDTVTKIVYGYEREYYPVPAYTMIPKGYYRDVIWIEE